MAWRFVHAACGKPHEPSRLKPDEDDTRKYCCHCETWGEHRVEPLGVLLHPEAPLREVHEQMTIGLAEKIAAKLPERDGERLVRLVKTGHPQQEYATAYREDVGFLLRLLAATPTSPQPAHPSAPPDERVADVRESAENYRATCKLDGCQDDNGEARCACCLLADEVLSWLNAAPREPGVGAGHEEDADA